jgi:hypothetical protein
MTRLSTNDLRKLLQLRRKWLSETTMYKIIFNNNYLIIKLQHFE